MTSIDGQFTLKETESAIRAQEAVGCKLNTLGTGEDNPPTNEADFDDLPVGQRPKPFRLTDGDIPDGRKEIWSGEIYVEGEKTNAKAYRDP